METTDIESLARFATGAQEHYGNICRFPDENRQPVLFTRVLPEFVSMIFAKSADN
ncbi:MAG: hypothetical protein ACXU8U_07550 [Asticcacaulis sp.]